MTSTFRQNDGSDVPEATEVLADRPAVEARRSAVVVVDMINWQVTPDVGLLGRMASDGVSIEYIVDRVRESVVPNVARLVNTARASGATVVYLRVGAARPDYDDGLPAFQSTFRDSEARLDLWAARSSTRSPRSPKIWYCSRPTPVAS